MRGNLLAYRRRGSEFYRYGRVCAERRPKGVRVIGLFGPESPTFYGPLGDNATAIYRPTPCSPCMNVYAAKDYRCPYQARCMQQIEVGDVAPLVETVSAR